MFLRNPSKWPPTPQKITFGKNARQWRWSIAASLQPSHRGQCRPLAGSHYAGIEPGFVCSACGKARRESAAGFQLEQDATPRYGLSLMTRKNDPIPVFSCRVDSTSNPAADAHSIINLFGPAIVAAAIATPALAQYLRAVLSHRELPE
jgi:hypothetical protein